MINNGINAGSQAGAVVNGGVFVQGHNAGPTGLVYNNGINGPTGAQAGFLQNGGWVFHYLGHRRGPGQCGGCSLMGRPPVCISQGRVLPASASRMVPPSVIRPARPPPLALGQAALGCGWPG